jgi:haloacid dehalogenase superfamily, subfamily IA, variant 3 with third motif having DD or ED
MSVQLFIFDLDGVLADTEPLHTYAKREILKETGLLTEKDVTDYIGKPNKDMWQEILLENGRDEPAPDALERRQYEIILEQMQARNIGGTEGLDALLDALASRGIKMGVCSSSDRHYVDGVLAILQRAERFDYIVGGDEVATKKPAPDGYLRVLALAGVAPGDAMALEDSFSGMTAACAAGIACVGLISPESGEQDLSAGIAQVHRLEEVIPLLDA